MTVAREKQGECSLQVNPEEVFAQLLILGFPRDPNRLSEVDVNWQCRKMLVDLRK